MQITSNLSLCRPLQLPEVFIFSSQFEQLAKREDWGMIVRLGKEALSVALDKDKARISAILASNAFYLGEYFEVKNYAYECITAADQCNDHILYVRGLYLCSAAERALGADIKEKENQRNHFQEAINLTHEALKLYDSFNLNEEALKGKIYFNLGAAHADDPEGDLLKALDSYKKAKLSFENTLEKKQFSKHADDSVIRNDIVRTTIRIGTVQLHLEQWDELKELIAGQRKITHPLRTEMHLDYLEAKFLKAQKRFEEAKTVIFNGKEKALKLNAKKDLTRFELLFESL
ncbi:MAG: hypothetical protein Tsb0021_18280 [Chlamydiales bacterium]